LEGGGCLWKGAGRLGGSEDGYRVGGECMRECWGVCAVWEWLCRCGGLCVTTCVCVYICKRARACVCVCVCVCVWTNRQTDRQTDRQIDKWIDRWIHTHTHTHTHTHHTHTLDVGTGIIGTPSAASQRNIRVSSIRRLSSRPNASCFLAGS